MWVDTWADHSLVKARNCQNSKSLIRAFDLVGQGPIGSCEILRGSFYNYTSH